jgi:hypothetical protein
MSDNTAATAYRRAAVLIKHHLTGNTDGINAVLQEVIDDNRLGPLLGGLLGSLTAITDQLVTDNGKEAIAELIEDIADHDGSPEPVRRAARYLTAFNHHDSAAMDSIIREAESVSPTIIGLLDIYTRLVPTMCSDIGLDIIDNAIRALSVKEVNGENPEANQ